MASLKGAGQTGLAGAELNAKIAAAGLSGAAGDKAKTRLKQAGEIKLEGGRWSLGQVGPKTKASSKPSSK